MSGPVTADDDPPVGAADEPEGPEVDVTESREVTVGGLRVRRALPRRARRTVGAWCFVDHMGPVAAGAGHGIAIGPHPHIGLQTVTWLFAGEVVHRDSLGSEQVIKPGQLNLMTAGHGVAHAEEGTEQYRSELHGMQLWVAQPSATRHGAAAFEHHADLPQVEIGAATATAFVGGFAGVTSPARRDTEHVGVELSLRAGTTVLPMEPTFEYALVVANGAVTVGGVIVEPGHLAYLGMGRDECPLDARDAARLLLLGGVPFPETLLMWWNYVARTRDEISAAHADWTAAAPRFGRVASPLARIDVDPPPWSTRI